MITGVFPISKATLVARELRCQGTTLESWARNHGVALGHLEDALNEHRHDLDHVLAELAETLGISVAVLRKTGA